MKEKVIFNWSGGKDSAYCLHLLLQTQQYDILCLLTSISEAYQRISMHGVRVDLLDAQAASIGLPLVKMQVPEMPTMEVYEQVMRQTVTGLVNQGATASVFGDIFLEDLRKYRETKLAELQLKGIFPLWKMPTDQLMRSFIAQGFKAIVTCVHEKYLDKSFAGRIIDETFLNDLPNNVDPCGENGEFHSFVFDGPIFSAPIAFETGEVVYRKYNAAPKNEDDTKDSYNCSDDTTTDPYAYGFWYCDLIPVANASIS